MNTEIPKTHLFWIILFNIEICQWCHNNLQQLFRWENDWGKVWVRHKREHVLKLLFPFANIRPVNGMFLSSASCALPFFSSFTTVISNTAYTTKSSDSRKKQKSHKRRKKNTICQLNTYKQICVSFPIP